jgi:hypothetical protein
MLMHALHFSYANLTRVITTDTAEEVGDVAELLRTFTSLTLKQEGPA